MSEFSFVVLHYMAYEETCICVDSIMKNIADDFSVVIVDNGSQNGSGHKLEVRYQKYNNIVLLHSDKNMGFAKGNNLGYKYAVQRHHSRYVICINNDVVIEQKDFLLRIKTHYLKDRFAVMGPDVISNNGKKHENPTYIVALDKYGLKKKIRYLECRLNYLRSSGMKRIIYRGLQGICRRDFARLYGLDKNPHKEEFTLHGSCIIFSKDYMDYNAEEAFFSGTFLYMEEEILQFICKSNSLKMVYADDIYICHMEDAATNYVVNDNKEKEIFKVENYINSAKAYYKLMETYENNKI